MALIGFHFSKMLVQKDKSVTGKVSVKNNIIITKIQEAKLNMGASKQAGAEFSFKFTVDYEPKVGSVVLEGAVVYMNSEEKIKEVITKWTKEKKLNKEVVEEVYNHLLHKCNVEALILARDMQLPAHIPMPKVKGD